MCLKNKGYVFKLPPHPLRWFWHFQFHTAFRAAFTLFAFLVGVHRARIRLNWLLHRDAALRTFSAHFTGAFLVDRATENSRSLGFGELHLAF